MMWTCLALAMILVIPILARRERLGTARRMVRLPCRDGNAGTGTGNGDDIGADWQAPVALVLSFLDVSIRRGTSIPDALVIVAQALPSWDSLGVVGGGLLRGLAWDDAWTAGGVNGQGRQGQGTGLSVVRDVLDSSWQCGSSPLGQIEAMLEQLDTRERMELERCASRLSVRLLLPTGLCFLPSFLCVAVVPTIMSFMTPV